METIKRFGRWIAQGWRRFNERFPNLAQFVTFSIVSNGVTVLQMVLMPVLWRMFNQTSLVDVTFQIWPMGQKIDGSTYYLFDYPAGALPDGGGGLAYFLAVQIAIAVAQVFNFFLQRSVTFKSNTSPWIAAMWYLVAYIAITILAAAAQGFYKVPIYTWMSDTFGPAGVAGADVVTMLINAMISFWVFYPIFKLIFRQVPEDEDADAGSDDSSADGSAADESQVAVAGQDSDSVGGVATEGLESGGGNRSHE
ncbi:MAG: hypothetical protein ACK5LS_06995 [Propioniciclava sp.]